MRVPFYDNIRMSAALCLVLGLTASGCVSAPVFMFKPTVEQPDCLQSAPEREVFVGLSVSGGGSRAALFAASAYEALGHLRVGPGTVFAAGAGLAHLQRVGREPGLRLLCRGEARRVRCRS